MMNPKDKARKEKVAHIIEIPDEYRLVVDDQEVSASYSSFIMVGA